MKKKISSEAELAAAVVAWLKSHGLEVYQEVQPRGFSSVADIVAVVGKTTWVIETKMSLSLALLEQAYRWTGRAHRISVATPDLRSVRGTAFAQDAAKAFGLGFIRVDRHGYVHESAPARFNRRLINDWLFESLREEHKTFAAAGTDSGTRWTPFQSTCRNIVQLVTATPGMEFREMMKALAGRHHYGSESSARGSLLQWLRAGSVRGVRIEGAARKITLWPA